MMLLQPQHCVLLYQPHCSSLSFPSNKANQFRGLVKISQQRKRKDCICALRLEDFAEIAHNKVLIAAGASAAIGQLSKPFTSYFFYGKDFDFRTALQAGGFPSTHSSAVVAAATSIALERGLSDSIFGLTLVYAGLIMYDAQGVRREVGNHARTLNKVIPKTVNSVIPSKSNTELINSQSKTPSPLNKEARGSILAEESSSFASERTNTPYLLKSDQEFRRSTQTPAVSVGRDGVEEVLERSVGNFTPLKESIGHTEVEVVAGALLGFFASLVVYINM